MEKQKHKPEQALMEAIGFDEDDLEANRVGYITKAQQNRLDSYRQSWAIWLSLAIGGLIVAAVMVIVEGIKVHDTPANRLWIIAFICMVSGGIAFYCWLNMQRYTHDLVNKEIHVLEGRVRLNISERGNWGTFYDLTIQKMTLSVNRPTLLAFKNGDPYILYYAPNTRTLLSAEWLREE